MLTLLFAAPLHSLLPTVKALELYFTKTSEINFATFFAKERRFATKWIFKDIH